MEGDEGDRAAGRAWQCGHQRELGVAEGSTHLAWAPGFLEHQSRSPAAHPEPLGPGLKAHTFWAWSQRHIPFFSSARHTGSIAFPHVCVFMPGRPVLPAWGSPQPSGLIKQKLATVCATLPTAWAHHRLEQLSLAMVILFLPSGSPESKGNAALQPVTKSRGAGWGGRKLDLLSQGRTGSESQHLRGQGPRRLSRTTLRLRDGETDHLRHFRDFPSWEWGLGWILALALGREVIPLPPIWLQPGIIRGRAQRDLTP